MGASDSLAGLAAVREMLTAPEQTPAAPEPNGRKRTPTASERRRIANTWSGRIGADNRAWIRELAYRYGISQGEVGRRCFEFCRAAHEAGEFRL